jgi:hypothetical protein
VAQKPVDKGVGHRFAELVGLGLTQHEAAGAVGIGTRTGERLMTKPELRPVVEQARTAGEGDPTIRALLEATDEAGTRTGCSGRRGWSWRVRSSRAAPARAEGRGACFRA